MRQRQRWLLFTSPVVNSRRYSPHAPAGEDASDLPGLANRMLAHLLPHLSGYIWQRDRFDLAASPPHPPPWRQKLCRARQKQAAPAPAPPCLWGSVGFGDNVEDEWLLVWLLLELTRVFRVTARCACARTTWAGQAPGNGAEACGEREAPPAEPRFRGALLRRACAPPRPARAQLPVFCVLRVWDNDGEFLLIEAAYALPRWLKPDTAQNRVRGASLFLCGARRAARCGAWSQD
jgi:hypothetical protein